MKKFAKISLAAAVAVAGLSSVASAKPLEEAIKGVDATGYVTYQYNDRNDKTGATNSNSDENIYKAAITLTVPATDDIAVKVTGVVRGVTTDNGDNGTVRGDGNPNTTLADAQFIYTGVEGLTAIVGKQAIPTPWTQSSSNIDPTQKGTGVLALYNAGFATFAAAHFVNNSMDGNNNDLVDLKGNDITAAAMIVPVEDIANLQVWYAHVGKDEGSNYLEAGANALSIAADFNILDVAKLEVMHSTFKGKDGGTLAGALGGAETAKLTKAVVSGSVADMVNLAAGYGKTGKKGHGVVAFDNDADANFLGWDVGLNGVANAKAYLLHADMDVLPDFNLGLTHVNAKAKDTATYSALLGTTGDVKWKETYATATYNFADNLYAQVMFGKEKMKDDVADQLKQDKGRLEVGFKF
ncbi:MAG: major outer membrane protein [Arcobacteraceae bacterium]|jgi:hypothetical protein|nr:major outer membrane protein [Arcobacteraceae bacterium]